MKEYHYRHKTIGLNKEYGISLSKNLRKCWDLYKITAVFWLPDVSGGKY